MRILLVTHYYPENGGGIEICGRRDRRRRLATGTGNGCPLGGEPLAELRRRDPWVAYVPMSAWDGTVHSLGIPYPLWSPESLASLIREVSRCDVVHIHDSLYLGNLLAASSPSSAAGRCSSPSTSGSSHIAD